MASPAKSGAAAAAELVRKIQKLQERFPRGPLAEYPPETRVVSCFECVSRLAKDPNAFYVNAPGTGKRCGPCSVGSNGKNSGHSCTPLVEQPDLIEAINNLAAAAVEFDADDPAGKEALSIRTAVQSKKITSAQPASAPFALMFGSSVVVENERRNYHNKKIAALEKIGSQLEGIRAELVARRPGAAQKRKSNDGPPAGGKHQQTRDEPYGYA